MTWWRGRLAFGGSAHGDADIARRRVHDSEGKDIGLERDVFSLPEIEARRRGLYRPGPFLVPLCRPLQIYMFLLNEAKPNVMLIRNYAKKMRRKDVFVSTLVQQVLTRSHAAPCRRSFCLFSNSYCHIDVSPHVNMSATCRKTLSYAMGCVGS